MNWIKRNWEVFMVVAIVVVALWTSRHEPPSTLHIKMTAHAQEKPSFSVGKDVGVFQLKTDVEGLSVHGHLIATLDEKGNLDVIEPEFWKMVEQHCVAIVQEKRTAKVSVIAPPSDIMPEVKDGYYIEHQSEVTARLRCH